MPRFVLALALLLAAATPAMAQLPPPVTGVIQSVEAQGLTLKTGDGKTVAMTLPADAIVVKNQKADFAAIKPGEFIASAAIEQQDGKLHAQEVRIFPEALRGRGEGHRPMAVPHETMTNATVERVVSASGGGVLTTKYPGGTTEIVVDPGTPITAIETLGRAALKPGVSISTRPEKAADGSLTARIVTVQ
jgi:hypothetical protein